MDIPRSSKTKRSRRIRVAVVAVAGVVAASIITVALARLKPADPTVDRDTIWTGTVERGQMLRQALGVMDERRLGGAVGAGGEVDLEA